MGRMLTNKALEPERSRQPASRAENAMPGGSSRFQATVHTRPAPSSQFQRTPPARMLPVAETVDLPQDSGLNRAAFYAGLMMLFLRVSTLPEVIYSLTGVNTKLLWIVAPLAIFGMLVNGSISRTLRHTPAKLWIGFVLWMMLATPFSSWLGGSVSRVLDYLEIELCLLFILGGSLASWRDVRAVFVVVAGGGVVNLFSAHLFGDNASGRLALEASGLIGNSNDLAAHLLLVMPFLLFFVLDPKTIGILKLFLMVGLGFGVFQVLKTGSRGALIALAVMLVFWLLRASMKQRAAVLVCTIALVVLAPIMLPAETMQRLLTLTGDAAVDEADQSKDSRRYLFFKSLEFTFQYPIFGVGPDQFSNFEGKTQVDSGMRGSWHATHNAYTQVSSEAGLPAALFFIGGMVTAWFMVHRVYRTARLTGHREVANACFCYLLALTGFMTAILFLSNAYRFYEPAMVGLAISLSILARQQLAQQQNQPLIPPRLF